MGVPIKRGIERIPGGMVIVPLSLGALIATFAPGAGQFFGSFTGALFTGALPILAVFYVCMGATIPFETLPQVAGKGGVLLAAKVLMDAAAALVLFLGTKPIETGLLAGLSTLAVVVAINDTNGGLYMLTVPIITAWWARKLAITN
jgi:2-keto-3-deoxygluconate permease